MTSALLLAGVVAALVFLAVLLVEGKLRPGYDPTYHTGSELELGGRGWIQRASFLLMGAGVFAFSLGVQRAFDITVGPALLAIFGVGMVTAGLLVPDAVRGYPPGAPSKPSAKPTWEARIHHVIGGPIAFLAIFGACLMVAAELNGAWQLYTVATAAVGIAMTFWTALAFQTDAQNTGIVQRGLILVYWSWIVLLGIHLVVDAPTPS